jgi:hypothetical protein
MGPIKYFKRRHNQTKNLVWVHHYLELPTKLQNASPVLNFVAYVEFHRDMILEQYLSSSEY